MLHRILKDQYTSLPPAHQKSLIYSMLDGSFALLHVSLMGGAFITGYALYLGANALHLALISSLPVLAQVMQVFSSYIEERIPKRKLLVAWGTGLSRQLCLFFPFIPLLFLTPTHRLSAFLSVTIIASILASMAINIWQSWMADVVPEYIWGTFFGIRTTVQNLTVTVGTFLFSGLLDMLQGKHLYSLSYFVLFFAASVSAAIALLFLLQIHEPPWKPLRHHSMKQLFNLPLKNPNYRKVLLFSCIWGFVTGIPMPFFSAHMLTNLDMRYIQIAIYSTAVTLTSLLAYPFWGKILDIAGAKPILKIAILGVGLLPLFWLFATPHFLAPLWIDAVLTGIFWAAINLALFNLVLSTSPRDHRSIYLALYASITGIATFSGSILGGWFAHAWSSFKLHLWGQTVVNFHCLFLVSSIGRWLALMSLCKINVLKEKSLSETLLVMRQLISARIPRKYIHF